MAQKLQFYEFEVVFRNTWKNQHGHIRVNLYCTRERAEMAAKNARTHMFQEIAFPVFPAHCLISGG